jgi:PhnB protein
MSGRLGEGALTRCRWWSSPRAAGAIVTHPVRELVLRRGPGVARKEQLGAKERLRLEVPGDKIAHAEIEIADSLVMLCDPLPQFVSKPPPVLGGTSAEMLMYVDDVDAVVQRAVDAGATVTAEVADQLWGDRSGTITDPFGQVWLISTHIEDLTPGEIAERVRAAMSSN